VQIKSSKGGINEHNVVLPPVLLDIP